MTIELNDQQIELLKEIIDEKLQEDIDMTTRGVCNLILDKLNEE